MMMMRRSRMVTMTMRRRSKMVVKEANDITGVTSTAAKG